jgi:hypothetical protein
MSYEEEDACHMRRRMHVMSYEHNMSFIHRADARSHVPPFVPAPCLSLSLSLGLPLPVSVSLLK